MDKHEVATAHDAIPVSATDAPYSGPPGQTRFENVHLVQPDGSLATVAVCRAINTRTHPELKLRALAGLLHRLEDGRELALSFVYHDPSARKFALVVPSLLAHTELKEWSRLMAAIGEDTRHLVPRYVRDSTTIIGVHALERYALDLGDGVDPNAALPDEPITNDLAAREHVMIQRERELAEQERALIRLAEGLTERESELNRRHEQLETARIDLEIRETELIDRRDDADLPVDEPGWTEVGVARTAIEATLLGVGPADAVEPADRENGATLIGVGPDVTLIGTGPGAALAAAETASDAASTGGASDEAALLWDADPALLAADPQPKLTAADSTLFGLGSRTRFVDSSDSTNANGRNAGRAVREFRGVRSARDSWLSPRHRPPPLPMHGSSAPPPLPLRARSEPPPLPLRAQSEPPPLRPRSSQPLAAEEASPPALLARIESPAPPSSQQHRQVPQPLAAGRLPSSAVPPPPLRTSSGPPPLPKHASGIHPAAAGTAAAPEVAPPVFFFSRDIGALALKLVDDELWLFSHVDESRAAEVQRGVELMLQYVELECYPVALLSVLSHGPEPYVLRHPLDGHSEVDRRVLEHLSRSFRVRLVLYVNGAYRETLTAATLREGVAQTILDRIAHLPLDRAALDANEAITKLLAAPPPLSHDDLPFGPARREASSTATVLASVEQLVSWLRPEKLEEATLIYSVPRNVIDATIRRVVRAAVAFGIALPDELFVRGVEYRAARDQPSLIAAQLQAFRLRVSSAQNDLGALATRKNWEQLFERAQALAVELDPELRALAQGEQPGTRPDATRPLRPFESLGPRITRALADRRRSPRGDLRALCARPPRLDRARAGHARSAHSRTSGERGRASHAVSRVRG
jgi:hypothetical protein